MDVTSVTSVTLPLLLPFYGLLATKTQQPILVRVLHLAGRDSHPAFDQNDRPPGRDQTGHPVRGGIKNTPHRVPCATGDRRHLQGPVGAAA